MRRVSELARQSPVKRAKKMEQIPKIAQRVLGETQKPEVHPDPDLLAAFAEKSLNDRERVQVLQHLSQCADCRDVVALAMPEPEPAPLSRPLGSPRLSWPVLRWGALAACVVVVSAAVTLHYERRQSEEASVAEKISASPRADGKLSSPPAEKMAETTVSPALPADRDAGAAAGKLAKQRETPMVAGPAAATKSAAPLESYLDEKAQQARAGSSVDALNPTDKPTRSIGALVAPPPPPLSAAKTAGAAPLPQVRNGAMDHPMTARPETVTVESAAHAAPATPPRVERKAKDESDSNELHKEAEVAQAEAPSAVSREIGKDDSVSVAAAPASANETVRLSQAAKKIASRWTLSADGLVQRSFDYGKSWQTIPLGNHVVFRALAANGSDIWAGGTAGALYHSSDAGQHWTQVTPAADGKSLSADIVAVEFKDAGHGTLTTIDRETWTTSNGGRTWQSH